MFSVKVSETHHLHQPDALGRVEGGSGEICRFGFECSKNGVRLSVAHRDKVLARALSTLLATKSRLYHGKPRTCLHLICFSVLARTLVEDFAALVVFGMELGCHGPDCVLQAHRGSPQWRAVEGLPVASGMHNRDVDVMISKEESCSKRVGLAVSIIT